MDKITMFFKHNYHYFVCAFISVFSILVFYNNLEPSNINYMLNSDILYFASVFTDIFIDGNSFANWSVPGAPGFFPDMLFYFLLFAVFKNVALSSMVFAILQFYTVIFLFAYIIKLVTGINNKFLIYAVTLFYLLFVVVGIFGNGFIITFHVLSNTYHIGPFVNSLLSLVFMFKYFNHQKIKYLVLLLLTGIIAIISDKLYIVMFTVPALFSVIVMYNKSNLKQNSLILGTILTQIVLGVTFFNLLKLSGFLTIRDYSVAQISVPKMLSSAQLLFSQLYGYFKTDIFLSLIVLIPLVTFITLLVQLFITFFLNKTQQQLNYITRLKLFVLCYMFIVFFTPVILGDYIGTAKIRYNISALYIGVLTAPVLLYQIKINLYKKVLAIIISGTYIFLLINLTNYSKNKNSGLKNYLNFYPQISQAVDNANNTYELKKGVATYWGSKHAWLFNKSGKKIYTANPTGYANLWIVCNSDWFFKNNPATNNVFNFVILNKSEDTTLLISNMGAYKKLIDFNDYRVFIYPDFIYNPNTKAPVFINK